MPLTPNRVAAARVASPAGSSTEGRSDTWMQARKRGTSCKATHQSWQPMGRSSRVGLWLLGLGALIHTLGSPPSSWAQSLKPIPLECRIAEGPWQSCLMEVIHLGRHWFLLIGSERFEFIHDGTGQVRIGKKGVWVEITPRWAADQSLCWGPVCARGDIPLD